MLITILYYSKVTSQEIGNMQFQTDDSILDSLSLSDANTNPSLKILLLKPREKN